jgi:hypothetical protein
VIEQTNLDPIKTMSLPTIVASSLPDYWRVSPTRRKHLACDEE